MIRALLGSLFAVWFTGTALAAPSIDSAGPASWTGDLSPIGPADWSYERARHLLDRAGFGGTPREIARLAAMTPEQAVDWLINYQAVDNSHVQPFDESGIFDPGMEALPNSRAQAVEWARENGVSLGVRVKPGGDRTLQPVVNKFFYYIRSDRLEAHRLGQYWAYRMLVTNRPLEEKLALFWHGHFATSDDKVRDYRKILRQFETFREMGTGPFGDLALAIARDPAMLVYLDAGENVKGSPNENFAREVLELFTLGIGNYTETDIREAARAFTGWTNDGLGFHVNQDQHDNDEKTFLGRTGNLDGADIIAITMEEQATSRFIGGKLYRYFVSDDPSPELLDEIATIFRSHDHNVGALLKTFFLSRDFYSPTGTGRMIKAPVELLVSSYRKLAMNEIPGVPDFNATTEALGQKLIYPPNVAGWAGGRSWITPATLVERGNFAREVMFPTVGDYSAPDRSLVKLYQDIQWKLRAGYDITSATIEGGGGMMGNAMEAGGMAGNTEGESMEGGGNMMSAADMIAISDEDFNTRYAAYHGTVEAMRRVKPIPRTPAFLDLTAMVDEAGLTTTTDVVDHFLVRLLSVPLSESDRAAMITFLTQELGTEDVVQAMSFLEEPLRGLVHLIMSTPEFQLS